MSSFFVLSVFWFLVVVVWLVKAGAGIEPAPGWLGGQIAVTSVSNPVLKRGGLAFNTGKNFATCARV